MRKLRTYNGYILSFLASVTVISLLFATALSAPGDLDQSFGQAGMAYFDYLPASGDMAYAVAVQSDGKILAAGSTGGGASPLMVRFQPDGSLDMSFGNAGVLAQFGPNMESIRAIAVQPDGRIVIAGGMLGVPIYVCRRQPDGSPDLSFGGFLSLGCRFFSWEDGSVEGAVSGIALQPNGKIVVAGTTTSENPFFSDFAVARLNTNGTFDNAFSGDGKLVTGFLSVQNTGESFCQAVAVNQVTGKIALAGYMDGLSGDDNFAIKLINPDGTLDASFNQSIFVPGRISDFFGKDDRAYGVVFQGSKIVTAGFAVDANYYEDFALAKYNGNGTLDSSFGFGGRLLTSVSDFGDVAHGIAMQSDGKIVVVGTAPNAGANGNQFALARYGPTGLLDSTFGSGGIVLTSYDTLSKVALATTLQQDGKIVVVGFTYNESFTDYQFAVARYLP